MKIRELPTVAHVIAAIGPERVKKVTRKRSNNLTNWKTANRFPPRSFLLLQAELERVRCRARPRLWGIDEPKSQRAA